MDNIKEQLEEVIKKNLPEKKTKNSIKHFGGNGYFNQQGFNQALSQINTSLIADEVLKVLVETKIIEEMLEYIIEKEQTIDGEWGEGRNFSELERDKEVPDLYYKIKKLLSNLSHNKENEIIHKNCGTKSCKGEYKDGVVDYLCKKCDCTFLDNDEQTIIS